MVRIILDTGIFFHPAALTALLGREEDIIVPAVTMAERVRQLRRDGRDEAGFHDLIERGEFFPEALTPDAACAVARLMTNDQQWRRLARDALIAAHVGPQDEIWTTNPRDFLELGLRSSQVVAIPRL